MADHAVSTDSRVQAQLDRLATLSPGADTLGLDRITRLLDRMGNPHHRLPPVFHVAGTNGKGSTCAFLRAALEAEGHQVHVYTSPHLVRFNERIRLAGQLIDNDRLARELSVTLDHADGLDASFFEVTTAMAYRLFADVPADACVIEVGLGGRLDATNVIETAAVCGVAQLAMDHEQFLGSTLWEIAQEKAAIAKPRTALVTQCYSPAVAAVVDRVAQERGARTVALGSEWDVAEYQGKLHYRDAQGRLDLDLPSLAGAHQHGNLGLAIAMLRHQDALPVSDAAMRAAPRWAHWPARMQRLEHGPLLAALPPEWPVWLDGGHNPAAGSAIAEFLDRQDIAAGELTIVAGMLANKNVAGFLAHLWPMTGSLHSVPVARHECHGPAAFAPLAASNHATHQHHGTVAEAIAAIAANPGATRAVLITGSLYLAGQVLEANGQLPD